jgi:SAM-dependent methyltransferase
MSFSSRTYWEQRYAGGGNAGAGSFGALARYKASVINRLVWQRHPESVVELGCGDGETAALFQFSKYVGLDVSETAIERCRQRFAGVPGWSFRTVTEQSGRDERFDMGISLDVIYHLVEDGVFDSYMSTLFGLSRSWVIIYSSDFEEAPLVHVRHRWFSRWVVRHRPEWNLVKVFQNPYPYHPDNPDNTTFANFSIFRHTADGLT